MVPLLTVTPQPAGNQQCHQLAELTEGARRGFKPFLKPGLQEPKPALFSLPLQTSLILPSPAFLGGRFHFLPLHFLPQDIWGRRAREGLKVYALHHFSLDPNFE